MRPWLEPAQLNIVDCAVYALANARSQPALQRWRFRPDGHSSQLVIGLGAVGNSPLRKWNPSREPRVIPLWSTTAFHTASFSRPTRPAGSGPFTFPDDDQGPDRK